jgi:hypothetical protein
MKKLDIDWFVDNWRWFVFISLMLVVIPSFIYHLATMNPQLRNSETRKQLRVDLEREMKEINLPSKTAVNKFESNDRDFLIFVQTRYRTETDEHEFVKLFTAELQRKGWISYAKNYDNYSFCRGQADATLFSEGKGGIFGDGANYFQLSFTMGMRPQIDNSSRPTNCR